MTRICNLRHRTATLVALALLALFLSGCGKPPPLIRQYVFEYAPPVVPAPGQFHEAIRVQQFSVDQAFNTTAMVYSPRPLESATYPYSAWRANPGHLVSDYLARDLRHAGLFQAVFTRNDAGRSRFILEGGVEEIQELNEPDGWKASLALTVTVLDDSYDEIPRRIVFQRSYRTAEPIWHQTPKGLAEAMSRAMQHLSQQIIADIQRELRLRLRG
jgi:ABC-type uncharacterized transport system auxiliary subunit